MKISRGTKSFFPGEFPFLPSSFSAFPSSLLLRGIFTGSEASKSLERSEGRWNVMGSI